jgi:hypothetical protein
VRGGFIDAFDNKPRIVEVIEGLLEMTETGGDLACVDLFPLRRTIHVNMSMLHNIGNIVVSRLSFGFVSSIKGEWRFRPHNAVPLAAC